ncbi:MAG TPA: hypothetical protein VGD53_17755 [Actinoallomurus sp.]|jgi:hypothetical protein
MTDSAGRTVIVLGDVPSTGHLNGAAAQRIADPPPASAAAYLDLVGRLGEYAEVLIVYPKWHADPARRLLSTVRGVLDTDRVASLGLGLPPLALSVVADVLAHAAPHLEMGVLTGLGERLAREVIAGARLASVAGLAQIKTGLLDHAASYVPRTGFVAWATQSARVEWQRRWTAPPPEQRPPDPVHLLVARQGAEGEDFRERLVSELTPHTVVDVAPQPLGRTYWGTRRRIEFVAFSVHPQVLPALTRSNRYWTCLWCGQLTSLETCAVCGMSQADLPGANDRWSFGDTPAPPDTAAPLDTPVASDSSTASETHTASDAPAPAASGGGDVR